jgi:hypothetical protein
MTLIKTMACQRYFYDHVYITMRIHLLPTPLQIHSEIQVFKTRRKRIRWT